MNSECLLSLQAIMVMLQGNVDLNTASHAKPLYCHGIS